LLKTDTLSVISLIICTFAVPFLLAAVQLQTTDERITGNK